MINIEFDEKSVFTYDSKNLSIGIWDHRDGKWKGPVIGLIGNIKFYDLQQLGHFKEMLEFVEERIKGEKKNDI